MGARKQKTQERGVKGNSPDKGQRGPSTAVLHGAGSPRQQDTYEPKDHHLIERNWVERSLMALAEGLRNNLL